MWLSGFQVVLEDQTLPNGAVRVEDGVIAEIRDRPAAGADVVVEGSGMLLAPALIDLHGDMVEREIEPRPGARFPIEMAVVELDKRYAAAGVGTAFVAVSFSGKTSHGGERSETLGADTIAAIRQMRGSCLSELRIHARFELTSPQAEPILRRLLAEGSVDLVALNDHTPGQGQNPNLDAYVAYVAAKHGRAPDIVAAEAQEMMAAQGQLDVRWAAARPLAELARRRGVALASHDDDTPEKVALMSALGVAISEFPVAIEAARAARAAGMAVLMGAPNALRGGSHRKNLSARACWEAGLLDGLAADYHPGALIRAALALHVERAEPLHKAMALVTAGPARAAGLADRGRVAVGARADLIGVAIRPTPRVRFLMRGGRMVLEERAGAGETERAR